MYLCTRHEALISPTLASLSFQRRQFRLNGVKTLLWKLLRKLLHYLPKITLQGKDRRLWSRLTFISVSCMHKIWIFSSKFVCLTRFFLACKPRHKLFQLKLQSLLLFKVFNGISIDVVCQLSSKELTFENLLCYLADLKFKKQCMFHQKANLQIKPPSRYILLIKILKKFISKKLGKSTKYISLW